ncbi:MAG: retropepsin-like domain-containing protein, partial [Planctomycetes bacterium]|nr:retropepsin-like domain-containing protein [Planctomycetota bacterium]
MPRPSRRLLLALLPLALACSRPPENGPDPGPPREPGGTAEPAPGGRAYPVVLFRGAPYVELVLGNARGLFLLDTGANISGVDESWLLQSGTRFEEIGRTSVAGTTGGIVVRKASVDRFDLGTGSFPDAVFVLQGYGGFSHPPQGRQVGLLGTDFINSYRISLDYGARRLLLEMKDERGPRPAALPPAPLDYPFGLPTARAVLGGVSLPCRIDTGASYIDPGPYLDVNRPAIDALRAAGIGLRESGWISVVGIAGPERLEIYTADGLRLELGPVAV